MSKQVNNKLSQSYSLRLCDEASSSIEKYEYAFRTVRPPKPNESGYSGAIARSLLSNSNDLDVNRVVAYLAYVRCVEECLQSAENDVPVLGGLLKKVDELQRCQASGTAKVKHIARTIEKLIKDYNCNINQLCDLVRGFMVYGTVTELTNVLFLLDSDCFGDIIDSFFVKNSFVTRSSTQYKDIKCSIKLKASLQVVELQLHIPEIYEVNFSGIEMSRMQLNEYAILDEEKSAVLEFTKILSEELYNFFLKLINEDTVLVKPHYLYEFVRSGKNHSSGKINGAANTMDALVNSIFREAYRRYERRVDSI